MQNERVETYSCGITKIKAKKNNEYNHKKKDIHIICRHKVQTMQNIFEVVTRKKAANQSAAFADPSGAAHTFTREYKKLQKH